MSEMNQGFLEHLQALPEPAKRRVLIVATAVAMAIVLYLWLAYFNSMVASFSQIAVPAAPVVQNTPAAPAPTAPTTPSTPSVGFGQQLYGGFVSFMHGLENIWSAPGQYNVQPPQQSQQ